MVDPKNTSPLVGTPCTIKYYFGRVLIPFSPMTPTEGGSFGYGKVFPFTITTLIIYFG